MDLSNLGTEQESCVMELLHPVTKEVIKDDKEKAFSISLLSVDTNQYKNEFNKVIKAARASKSEQTATAAEKRACELLASMTTDCHLIMDGKKLPSDAVSMTKLFMDPKYTWIREDVEAYIRDRSNFMKS